MNRKILVSILGILMVFSLCVPAMADGNEQVMFEMQDPAGDDYGPGTYTYPTNIAFSPGRGHYDLINFKVFQDDDYVFFDFEFTLLDNTWQADEGFSHQLIDLYIDTGEEGGRTDAFNVGPNVSFSPEHPWNVYIRVAPWKSSLFHACKTPETTTADVRPNFSVERVPSTNIIRAMVDKKLIGDVDASWNYYVLVGSYDGYGLDCYRPVEKEAGAWVFGGGSGDGKSPNVIDILAEESGKYSQHNQLTKSSSGDPQAFAELFPVNSGANGSSGSKRGLIMIFGAVAVVGAGAVLVKMRSRSRKRSENSDF